MSGRHFTRSASGLVIPADIVANGLLTLIRYGPRVPWPPAVKEAIIAEALRQGCWLSGQPITQRMIDDLMLHIDHVIPWSYGGSNSLENLRAAIGSYNMKRGNSLEEVVEAGFGFKDTPHGRVPDYAQRLIRVGTDPENGLPLYWSVPRFDVGHFAGGTAGAAGFAALFDLGFQVAGGARRFQDLDTVQLAEAAGVGGATYAARFGGKYAVQRLAPHAVRLGVSAGGVEALGALAGPIGIVVGIYGAELVEQGVALGKGKVGVRRAAKNVALAPVSFVTDTADLAIAGYKAVSPKHRARRKYRRKAASLNFTSNLGLRTVLVNEPSYDDRVFVASRTGLKVTAPADVAVGA
jgi:hypothetical protein